MRPMRGASVCATLILAAGVCAASATSGRGLLVIGAGQGRTGTESLRIALNALNAGPTYHMSELLGIDSSRPVSAFEMLGVADGHCDEWIAVEANASRGLPVHWGFLEGHYNASVDLPSAAYFAELLQAKPEAKVILTVRDARRVHQSSAATWCRLIGVGSSIDWLVSAVYSLRPYGRRFFRMHDAMGRATGRALGRQDFSFRRVCEDAAYGVAFFEDWNALVRRVVPPHQLLVFETGKHGYTELARFLGVEAPRQSYPRTNAAADFAFVLNIMRLLAVLTIAAAAAIAALGCRSVAALCRHLRGRGGPVSTRNKKQA